MQMKHLVTMIILTAAVASSSRPARGDSYSFGLSLGGGYIPDAKITPTGQDETTDFHYHGAHAEFSVFRPYNRNGYNGSMGGYVQAIALQNNYAESKDPNAVVNAGKSQEDLNRGSHETVTAASLGAELVNNFFVNFQTLAAVGLCAATIKQDGDTPKTQTYNFGGTMRLGLGIGPRMGESGLAIRGEYQYIVLVAGREKDNPSQKLYNLNAQMYGPTLTFVLGF